LKKIFKYTGYIILFFVVFVLLYLLVAYALSRITVDKEMNQPEEIAIYIKTNGVHTDLVLPAKSAQLDWTKEI